MGKVRLKDIKVGFQVCNNEKYNRLPWAAEIYKEVNNVFYFKDFSFSRLRFSEGGNLKASEIVSNVNNGTWSTPKKPYDFELLKVLYKNT